MRDAMGNGVGIGALEKKNYGIFIRCLKKITSHDTFFEKFF